MRLVAIRGRGNAYGGVCFQEAEIDLYGRHQARSGPAALGVANGPVSPFQRFVPIEQRHHVPARRLEQPSCRGFLDPGTDGEED